MKHGLAGQRVQGVTGVESKEHAFKKTTPEKEVMVLCIRLHRAAFPTAYWCDPTSAFFYLGSENVTNCARSNTTYDRTTSEPTYLTARFAYCDDASTQLSLQEIFQDFAKQDFHN